MGLKTFRCLEDFARHRCAIAVVCDHCRREVTFSARRLIDHFKRRGMTTWLPWAGRYFVCRGRADIVGCGHRGATLRPAPEGPPDDKPPTGRSERVPLGIDRDAWARADERGRKRLIRRARG